MNFKFNWLKGTVSLIFGIVGGWFFYIYSIAIYFKAGTYNNPSIYFIPIAIISILIIYTVWSLIQKK
jgi:membrane protein implicated in regulation of membrane protease activity